MSVSTMVRTASNEVVRVIELVHLDGSIRTSRDDGCNAQGKPNQLRQHIIAMLRKRTTIPVLDSEGNMVNVVKDEDGRPLGVPVFRLAKPPQPFPYDRMPERIRGNLQAADTFDRDVLRNSDGGGWLTPSDLWRSFSKTWCTYKGKAAREATEKYEQATRNRAGEALEDLMVQLAKSEKKTDKQQGAGRG